MLSLLGGARRTVPSNLSSFFALFVWPPCAALNAGNLIDFDDIWESEADRLLDEPKLRLPPVEAKCCRILGFFPLSSTLLRALMPMQSTSCFIASRSDTTLCWALRWTLAIFVTRIVLIDVGGAAGVRIGVTSP